MKHRRLRKLVPDDDLIRRRAAGEPLRQLAPDYGVQHSALSRYFRRPEVAKQVREARRVLRAAEREVERKAKEERKLERERARRERELAARRARPAPPLKSG